MSGGDTVMSSTEDLINDTRKAVKEVRRRAFWFNPADANVSILVGPRVVGRLDCMELRPGFARHSV